MADELDGIVSQLSPQELQQIHTMTYQAKVGPNADKFDQAKVDKLWGAIQPVVARGGGPDLTATRSDREKLMESQPITPQADTRTWFQKLYQPSPENVDRAERLVTGGRVQSTSQLDAYIDNPAIPKTFMQEQRAGMNKSLAELGAQQFTTPLGIAQAGMPIAETLAVGKGLLGLARGLSGSMAVMGHAQGVQGVRDYMDAQTPAEKTLAAANAVMGFGTGIVDTVRTAAGHPTPATQPRGATPVEPVKAAAPEAVVAKPTSVTPDVTPQAAPVLSNLEHPIDLEGKAYQSDPVSSQPPQPAATVPNPSAPAAPAMGVSVESRPDTARPPATQTKIAAQAATPLTPEQLVNMIGDKKEGLVRPSSLPDADLKTISDMPQKATQALGLSRDDHMAAVAEATRRFGSAPSQKPAEDIHTAITRITKASTEPGSGGKEFKTDLDRRQSEFRQHLQTLMKAPVDDQVRAAQALELRYKTADETIGNIQRVMAAKDFAGEVTAARTENKLGRSATVSADQVGYDSKGNLIVTPQIDPKTGKAVQSNKAAWGNYTPSVESVYNDLIVGRKTGPMRDIYDSTTGKKVVTPQPATPEEAADVAAFTQRTKQALADHIKEVRAQGGVPTEAQKNEGMGLIDSLHNITGQRISFVGRGTPELGDRETWNKWMGRKSDARVAKPSDEQVARRISQLTTESRLAKLAAVKVRSAIPPDHAESLVPTKTVAQTATTPPETQELTPQESAAIKEPSKADLVAQGQREGFKSVAAKFKEPTGAPNLKQELHQVFDFIGESELKSKRKFNIQVHDVNPNVPLEVPPTWHDGTFRYTALRTPDGQLRAGASGSYDTIMNTGAASAKSGIEQLPAGHKLYVIDLGPGESRQVHIYNGAEQPKTSVERVQPSQLPAEAGKAPQSEAAPKALEDLTLAEVKAMLAEKFPERAAEPAKPAPKATKPPEAAKAVEPAPENLEGKSDDLLIHLQNHDDVPRPLKDTIAKLHAGALEDNRDVIAHAAVQSGKEGGELAKRYAGGLEITRKGLLAGDPAAILKGAKYAQEGTLLNKKGQEGFVNANFSGEIAAGLNKQLGNPASKVKDIYKWMDEALTKGTWIGLSQATKDRVYHYHGQIMTQTDLGRITAAKATEVTRKFPAEQQLQMMADWVHGKEMPTQDLEATRRMFQSKQNEAWEKTSEYSNVKWLDNHLRTFWKVLPSDGDKMIARSANEVNKSQLQGDRGFMRKRIFSDVQEGMKHGGVPATTNPFEMSLLDLASQHQFIAARDLLKGLKEDGRFGRGKEAAELMQDPVPVDQNIISSYYPVETVDGRKVMTRGSTYYMERGEHEMFQKMLSPDLIRQNVLGKTFLGVKNFRTQTDLFGIFHVWSIIRKTIQTQVGRNLGAGWNEFATGHPIESVKKFAETLDSLREPYKLFKEGQGIKQAGGALYEGKLDEFLQSPAGKDLTGKFPKLPDLIPAMLDAGLHFQVDPRISTRIRQSMMDNWAQGDLTGRAKALIQSPVAGMEKLMAPLFEHYIPLIKLAAGAREMTTELRRNANYIANGEMTEAQSNQRAVRRVENIFGQMNWDHLLLSKTWKSAMQGLWTSATWRLGTADLAKNAVLGQAREFKNAIRDRRLPLADPDAMQVLSTYGTTAAASAVTMYLMAGKLPQSTADLKYPQIGEKDSRGKPLRAKNPDYTADFDQLYSKKPWEYALGGQSSLVTRSVEAWTNRDYEGQQISEKRDMASWPGRIAHVLMPTPYMFTGVDRMEKQGVPAGKAWGMAAMGLNPAKRDVDMTESEKILSESERRVSLKYSAKQLEAKQAKQSIQGALQSNRDSDANDLQVQAVDKGILKPREAFQAQKDAQLGNYFTRMAETVAKEGQQPVKALVEAYKVATPDERDQLMPILVKMSRKHPEVIDEIDKLEGNDAAKP